MNMNFFVAGMESRISGREADTAARKKFVACAAGVLRFASAGTNVELPAAQLLKQPAPSAFDAERHSVSTDVALLILVFGLIFFFDLGETALVNPDEGRYAEIPREMVASNDYVTPRLNGVVYFEKPPLVYWMVAGLLRVFGPEELAIRTVPAVFALCGVVLTYLAARRLHGRTAGIASTIVLGSSLLYFALGRILLLDMVVSVLMSATLFCFLLGVGEAPGPRRWWLFHGLYASAALATLAKGLIGFLLPCGVMFLWLLLFNQWHRLRPFYLVSGGLLFLAIAAPWHVLAAQRNPEWAHFYFVHEHWQRFTTPEHGRIAPWWYFAPVVLAGFFPWTGCLWPAVRSALAGGWAKRNENAVAWFLVTWAAFVFLFFSKSQSKLIPYILPVFPPLAVLIGVWLSRAWQEGAVRRLRPAIWIFGAMAGALSTCMLTIVLKPALVRNAAALADLLSDGIVASVVMLAGAFLVPWFCLRGHLRASLIALATSVAGLYLVLGESQDKIARPGTKPLAQYVKAHSQAGDRIYHYYEFFHDFTFYAERFVGIIASQGELELAIDPAARASGRFIGEEEFRVQWTQPGRLWVIARKKDVVGKLFADSSFHYHLLAETRSYLLFSNKP